MISLLKEWNRILEKRLNQMESLLQTEKLMKIEEKMNIIEKQIMPVCGVHGNYLPPKEVQVKPNLEKSQWMSSGGLKSSE